MLRAENCICGTTSTGTGTLTLAACPAPPGGTDLFQAFVAQALGTAVAIPISYTIIEYTGSTFQTASKQEKGIGSLTLGANIGATTLARTTVQQTAINMDTTATYDLTAPTAVSISQAVNTLVFIGSSASDLVGCSPYYDLTLPSSDTLGGCPVNVGGSITGNISLSRNNDNYHLFEWRIPTLVKRVSVNLATAFTGTARIYGRLYAVGVNARPTKLLYDFGISNTGLSAIGIKTCGTASDPGFYLQPGEYFLDTMLSSSSVGPPIFSGFTSPYNPGRLGYGTGIGPVLQINATSASTLAGDPANVTSLDMAAANQLFFSLK